MTELVQERPRLPEVRIVPKDQISREWMDEFNLSFAALPNGDQPLDPQIRYVCSVDVEQWLEQDFKGQPSSDFRLSDITGPNGWVQRITGKVMIADEEYLPREVGGGRRPVLVLHDAYILLPGSSQVWAQLAEGRFVFIELDKIADPEIALDPFHNTVA